MATCSARAARGGALLAVLWLSAALAAIAFSLANTVRGETERASTGVDGLRSQYLAAGALRRAILYMDWGRKHPDDPRFKPAAPVYPFEFPAGQATVEVIPETAKLNLNSARPEDLLLLLANLGVNPADAQEIVSAIVDWRNPPGDTPSPFDAFYASLRRPYRASHAPFQEVEELLAVQGVTPDLFYPGWERAPAGAQRRFFPRTGLRDCVSVFGATAQFDVNTAPPAVLAAAGVPPDGVAALVAQRRAQPFLTQDQLAAFAGVAGPGFPRLGIGGHSIFTLRSTARLRLKNGQLSDMRRTVAALVKFMPAGYDASYHILRWYDNVTAPE
jgi:general secretion pathway protein K